MRHTDRIHSQLSTTEPNLFDFVPKQVWREVYRGRWAELGAVQKAEFIVEVIFLSCSSAAYRMPLTARETYLA